MISFQRISEENVIWCLELSRMSVIYHRTTCIEQKPVYSRYSPYLMLKLKNTKLLSTLWQTKMLPSRRMDLKLWEWGAFIYPLPLCLIAGLTTKMSSTRMLPRNMYNSFVKREMCSSFKFAEVTSKPSKIRIFQTMIPTLRENNGLLFSGGSAWTRKLCMLSGPDASRLLIS